MQHLKIYKCQLTGNDIKHIKKAIDCFIKANGLYCALEMSLLAKQLTDLVDEKGEKYDDQYSH